jgi:AcrR family transcriptional regulator
VSVTAASRAEDLRPPRLGPPSARLTDRQREILDGLEEIIITEGFRHLTVGSLASRLHCSRATMYELAPTKDELVLVVLDRRLRRVGHFGARALATEAEPGDRLEAFMLAGAELRPESLRLTDDIAAHPAAQRLLNEHWRYATAIIEEIIADGMARGAFRPVNARIIAEIVDASLGRFGDPGVQRATSCDLMELTADLVALLRQGLEA